MSGVMSRVILLLLLMPLVAHGQTVRISKLPQRTSDGSVEVHGVAAGGFDPTIWDQGAATLVPDVRHPLIEPQPGPFRNIYAPSIVQIEGDRWRIFYGGWDGVDTGNDRIYSADTADFLSFDNRHTVIEHGVFQHVCNVSAIRV